MGGLPIRKAGSVRAWLTLCKFVCARQSGKGARFVYEIWESLWIVTHRDNTVTVRNVIVRVCAEFDVQAPRSTRELTLEKTSLNSYSLAVTLPSDNFEASKAFR